MLWNKTQREERWGFGGFKKGQNKNQEAELSSVIPSSYPPAHTAIHSAKGQPGKGEITAIRVFADMNQENKGRAASPAEIVWRILNSKCRSQGWKDWISAYR